MTTIERARAALDKDVTYVLGQPERVIPRGATEAPLPKEADCSGFAFWCLQMERFQPAPTTNGRLGTAHLSTTVIAYDAISLQQWFVTCPPEPGCLIVYPAGKGQRYGHIGIVSEVVDGKVTRVIHCAASHPKGRAVQETDPGVFVKRGAITVRRKT